MEEQEQPLSLVLFSGTDDKLTAASVLAVGAAAMGRPVNIFLQYYALDAFRRGTLYDDHKLSSEATDDQVPAIKAHAGQHWSELLRQAKGIDGINMCEKLRGFRSLVGLEVADHVPLGFRQIAHRLGFRRKLLNAILAEDAQSSGIGFADLFRGHRFRDTH